MTKYTVFLSDLHLSPERPAITNAFLSLLADQKSNVDAIYLLGDLFEYWIGDDAASMLGVDPVLDAMRETAKHRPCYFIAGNRDFLVGNEFSNRTGFSILPDETLIDLYGETTLLLHGDSMCSDDVEHQQFRQKMVTNLEWRGMFLSHSITERIELAKQARMQSQQHKSQISMKIMDVNKQTVLDTFLKFDVQQMIHGHTHRQYQHDYSIDSNPYTRYVLGDWGDTSSVLLVNSEGFTFRNQKISLV